jgi:pimeloyl-ACP methyl ester carboxylesterase
MPPRLRLAAAAATCLVALAATALPARAATPPGGVPVLDWRPCDEGFDCATARVPRDYAHPHGPTVSLALIRHRAVDREHRIGTLFLNPGGPGSSGVDFVRGAPPVAFQALARFDWVGFDPRGVGASEPAVDCDELDPAFAPMTPDTFDRDLLIKRASALTRLCLNRDPAFLASLTTGNVARDLDLLRAAVGDEKLTYIGFSYGGAIGETYASLFPGRARAMVLDSTVDADVWLNRELTAAREQLAGFEHELDRFFTACARDQATCGFGGADPERAFDELVDQLDAAPVAAPDGHHIDGLELETLASEAMYAKARWQPLASALAGLANGDPGPLLELDAETLDPAYDLLYDVFNTYGEVERRRPRGIEPYLRYAEELFSSAPHFARGSYEALSEAFWPIRPRGAFYGPFRNPSWAAPVLVLQSTHDPATPYEWGKRVVRQLGNARLLTLHGDGHGILTQLNQCALAAVVPYLYDLALPPKGATCEQEVRFGGVALAHGLGYLPPVR